ncbi:hypothetical protein [Candidatus Amarobacter glycogenicus]|uniref:hypothetical protein n=1 Tax=Candidatus Amarobacter glycogenicus TaxID=3140699 RepID=UPI0031CC91BC
MKEIGTDALFALHRVSRQVDQKYETDYLRRVQAFYKHCGTTTSAFGRPDRR